MRGSPCCWSRETFVRPRYHQGSRWVRVRESLGPEDDAFRSGHRKRGTGKGRGTVVLDDPVAHDVACPPRRATAFIKSLIRFRFGRRAATTDTVIIFISTALTVLLVCGANSVVQRGTDEFLACQEFFSFCRDHGVFTFVARLFS